MIKKFDSFHLSKIDQIDDLFLEISDHYSLSKRGYGMENNTYSISYGNYSWGNPHHGIYPEMNYKKVTHSGVYLITFCLDSIENNTLEVSKFLDKLKFRMGKFNFKCEYEFSILPLRRLLYSIVIRDENNKELQ